MLELFVICFSTAINILYCTITLSLKKVSERVSPIVSEHMFLRISEHMSLIVGHLPFSDNSHFCHYSLYSISLYKWNYSVSNLSCLTSFAYQKHPHCWVILYITGCYSTIWPYSNLLIFAQAECHLHCFCVTVTLVWKEHASPSIMTPGEAGHWAVLFPSSV